MIELITFHVALPLGNCEQQFLSEGLVLLEVRVVLQQMTSICVTSI